MIDPMWMQEQFYRRIVTRYEGVRHNDLIFFDAVLPFSDLISVSVAMFQEKKPSEGFIVVFDEARAYFENRLSGSQRWNCTLWLQGYGFPRRDQPIIEIVGNEEQMIEDIFVALLKI